MKQLSNLFLILVFGFFILSCSEDDSSGLISTDISVSISQNLVIWNTQSDLMQSLEDIISFNTGSALESEVEKTLTFNTDSTQVNAKINFRTQFENKYRDSNPFNNETQVNLEKSEIVTLNADGPGNTYELITSVLAPGNNPVEVPDCNHADYGRHIDEVFDDELNKYVFRFIIHTNPDNDRCLNFDRQRNEIKSYSPSPQNLLGIEEETVVYKWRFKLNDGFQSSPNFTHIHQLKSVGGDLDAMPMYTLTTRKGTPDKLQLRYAETDNQNTIAQVDLEPFINTWVEVTQTITYGFSGSYSINIKRISDNTTLLSYNNNNIINWRPNASFVRPKWGIYRSLINIQDLRDEEVYYSDFSIQEILN